MSSPGRAPDGSVSAPPTSPPLGPPRTSSAPPPPWPPPSSPRLAGPGVRPGHRRPRHWAAAAAISIAAAALAVATASALSSSPSTPRPSFDRLPSAPAAATVDGADTSSIVRSVDAAIVDITTSVGDGRAAGTGMVLTADGLVLTNNHVIEGATSIAVQIGGSGRTYRGHVVGYDVKDDVAVVQLDDASGLATIPVGDSSTLRVGDAVVAIGNALGESGPHAVTTGQVEALDQTITADGDGPGSSETLHGLIQHDAGLQPGDSGGALVDSAGKVVGMNSAALAAGRRFATTPSTESYAIPIADALSIAHQIIDGKASANIHIGDRAVLGVEIAQFDSSDGVAVAQVDEGSPAADAGVQPGDTITAVDGTDISSLADLQDALGSHHPGDHVKLGWESADGTTHSAAVTLIAGPPA
jgi:S1-C subfamily serine protease